jgi:hypothetical protein
MRFLPKQSKQVDCAPFSMHGLVAGMLAVGMLLLAPYGAAAQACTCVDSGLEAPLSAADAETFEQLQAQLDAQPHSSLPVLAAPAETEDLPWCTGQNEAQCSKRPIGSTPSSVSLGATPSLMIGSLLPLPSPSSSACDFAEYSFGGPRDAVRSKLERPPQ